MKLIVSILKSIYEGMIEARKARANAIIRGS